jgi:hypothetical protein
LDDASEDCKSTAVEAADCGPSSNCTRAALTRGKATNARLSELDRATLPLRDPRCDGRVETEEDLLDEVAEEGEQDEEGTKEADERLRRLRLRSEEKRVDAEAESVDVLVDVGVDAVKLPGGGASGRGSGELDVSSRRKRFR